MGVNTHKVVLHSTHAVQAQFHLSRKKSAYSFYASFIISVINYLKYKL